MGEPTGTRRQSSPYSHFWVDNYRPKSISHEAWSTVRPFVTSCASQLDVPDDPRCRRALGLLARLSVWALVQGLPLDTEAVLDPHTVERFVTSTVAHPRSASTYRSDLRRLGLALTKRAPWEPLPAGIARRQIAQPYTPVELEHLKVDARAQSTRRRIRAARAFLALGAGAGLDGRWVGKVAATDITISGTGAVLVSVDAPSARHVPVLVEWEDEVLDLATFAGPEFLIGGHSTAPNRVGDLLQRIEAPRGHPKLSPARLRTTWLATHLALGTRLPELAAAAGLRSLVVLSDLLPHIELANQANSVEMLRGPR